MLPKFSFWGEALFLFLKEKGFPGLTTGPNDFKSFASFKNLSPQNGKTRNEEEDCSLTHFTASFTSESITVLRPLWAAILTDFSAIASAFSSRISASASAASSETLFAPASIRMRTAAAFGIAAVLFGMLE